jgi:hypothetical protein
LWAIPSRERRTPGFSKRMIFKKGGRFKVTSTVTAELKLNVSTGARRSCLGGGGSGAWAIESQALESRGLDDLGGCTYG